MSVDRVGRSRLERADVTTSAVRSGDTTLISRRTSSSVSGINCRAACKESDRRGGPAIIAKWTKLGVGAVQTARRCKVATGVRADVVTAIRESAEAVTTRKTVGQDRVQNGRDGASRDVNCATLANTIAS